jgi:hypothetical protein
MGNTHQFRPEVKGGMIYFALEATKALENALVCRYAGSGMASSPGSSLLVIPGNQSIIGRFLGCRHISDRSDVESAYCVQVAASEHHRP